VNPSHSPITPETLQLLAERVGIALKPEELEPLCRVYLKLEQMKTLVRKPRDYRSGFPKTFEVHPQGEP
jgi:hypothetical protein